MKELNEESVLDFYLEQLKIDNITFLKNKGNKKKNIESLILALKAAPSMNEKISVAKNLWKALFDASMSYIDPNKDGYDTLFKYFDSYVEFEELIFASDSFYRDHTLHCLWVYFLGEYIIKNNEFSSITAPMYDEVNRFKKLKDNFKELKLDNIFESSLEMFDKVITTFDYLEAVCCVNALTHDLGYPLKKIDKINKSIKNILPNFSIKNYNDFNFSYTNIDQNFIQYFIKFLCSNYNVVVGTSNFKSTPEIDAMLMRLFILGEHKDLIGLKSEEVHKLNDNELEILKEFFKATIRIYEVPKNYWRFCNDFENYKHGIMSAFLLVKNIKAFSNIEMIYSEKSTTTDKQNWENYTDTILKSAILTAISNHTSDGYKISEISDTSAFLTFIDELEEFSRISRANQNREYVEEFCTTNIYMEDVWFNIDFTFDNTSIDNLDPERAFKGRCNRFLSLFDIPNLSESVKIRLRCIGRLPENNNTYTLELAQKYASITINDEEKDIPTYLKSNSVYSREEYASM